MSESVVLAQFIDAILAAADDPWRQGRLLAYVRRQESADLVDLAKLLLEDEHRHDGTRWHCLEILHRHMVAGKIVDGIRSIPDQDRVQVDLRTGVCFVWIPRETTAEDKPSDGFWISRYPISVLEYDQFLRASKLKESTEKLQSPLLLDPVDGISWSDLHSDGGFLEWSRYRLPTRSEWLFASQGQQEGIDPAFILEGRAWFGEAYDDERLHPLGLLKPNGFGLCDCFGNVHEMTQEVRWNEYWSEDIANWDYDTFQELDCNALGGCCQSSAESCLSYSGRRIEVSCAWKTFGFRVISPVAPKDSRNPKAFAAAWRHATLPKIQRDY